MAIDSKLIDELLKEGTTAEELFGDNGVLKELQKRLLERILEGEMTDHLGYVKHKGSVADNKRNGHSSKSIKGTIGKIELKTPRDRHASFEPKIVGKYQTRFDGFDKMIIALYARGMTTRDIQGQLLEVYGVEVSPTLISHVTDSVMHDVRAWQNRPLESVYLIVYLDALRIKIKTGSSIVNKAVYLALGISTRGEKELLGVWIAEQEGAKFWLGILNELRNRGLEDILIACVDGLSGFVEAIEAAYPQTTVQLCVVHMIRNSFKYVSWKDRKALASDLKQIYQAVTLVAAEQALQLLKATWGNKYPAVPALWERHWENIIPFFAFSKDIRRVIYTINAIESLNMVIRKVTRNKRMFPSEDAALKVLYLALNKAAEKWKRPTKNWTAALMQLNVHFQGRLNL